MVNNTYVVYRKLHAAHHKESVEMWGEDPLTNKQYRCVAFMCIVMSVHVHDILATGAVVAAWRL